MKTLEDIRNEYINLKNAESKAMGFGEDWMLNVSDLTYEDAGEMMDEWNKHNPMPEFTSVDDYGFAFEKAMWMLRRDEAATYFSGEEYPLQVSAYRWNIEQAIINRDSSKTMAHAAQEYVENLTSNLPD